MLTAAPRAIVLVCRFAFTYKMVLPLATGKAIQFVGFTPATGIAVPLGKVPVVVLAGSAKIAVKLADKYNSAPPARFSLISISPICSLGLCGFITGMLIDVIDIEPVLNWVESRMYSSPFC